MKNLLVLAAFCGVFSFAQAQLKTPPPSVGQTIKQEFALTSIEVDYSRPSMKGRKIMGDLVPYGKVWRTGANGATTISFKDEVIIGDKKVPAGKYGLLTIPGQSEWTVIITKQTDVTSPSAYKADQDVVRVNVPSTEMPFPVETFMILFNNATATSIDLMMIWEQTAVSFPIKMEVDSKVMAQINEQMKSAKPPYFQAAMYYLENGKDLNKAAEWLDKATAETPDAFWVWHQKANALAKLGKKKDAIAAANKSIELATTAKNEDYVQLNKKLLASLN
jgi:tetratricopeptide (TPR) repeat protein